MSQNYRDVIYKNYASQLAKAAVSSDYEKEKEITVRYFNRNYLPHFPSKRDSSIVDIGCGKGTFLNACIQQGYTNVLGVDLSEQNVEFCKSQGFQCQYIDGQEYLKSKRNSFDIIIFNDVIEHLTKDEILEMLLTMKEALKENGKLIVKTMNMANPYTGPACLFIDFTHETGFTEINLVQIFEAIGFSNVTVFGSDIYVFKGFVNFAAKMVSKIICKSLYFKSHLFGRKSIKIFEKNLICVAQKTTEKV